MNDISELKNPPSAMEAEASVLGALLSSNDSFDLLAGKLAEADFYTHDNRLIFRAIAALLTAQKPADAISVAQWLKDRNELDKVGGFAYLQELQSGHGLVTNLPVYAELVREKAVVRAILTASMAMGDLAYAPEGKTASQILDQAQALLAAVDERSKRGEGTFRPIGEAIAELVAQIDGVKDTDAPLGVRSGFEDLDRLFNPMTAGQLIVVGARPAVGKTSFAVNVAMHVAMQASRPVGMFSMEMTDIELAVRILSGFTGMPAGRFREHRFSEKEWERVSGALGKLAGANLYVDHSGGLSIQELTARARLQSKRVGGFGLLIVDYLQLSRSEGRYDNRAVEIGAVTSGLKRLAKELQCPIMALSQLNREAAKEKKRPSIAELRDSGAIEADADTVLLLHRDYVMTQNIDVEFDAEVIIGKQRNGQIGMVHLDYDARLTRFFNRGEAPGRGPRGGAYSAAAKGE